MCRLREARPSPLEGKSRAASLESPVSDHRMEVEHRRTRLGLFSTGRHDWGVLRSTCVWLASSPHRFDVRILLGGMACSERYGRVDRLIEAEGFAPHERLAWLDDREPALPHHEASRALAMIGDALVRQHLDALLVVGDRSEILAAAMAATVLRIPIVHLHGGEETEGAFDNAIRHAVTKLAHLHLASHATYARRIVSMGEDPSTVHVVGAPGLDNLSRPDLATRTELEDLLGARLVSPVVVVTVHPTTLAVDLLAEVDAVCAAMREVGDATFVVTLPNSDPGNEAVRTRLLDSVKPPRVLAVDALGERRYWGLLRIADAMLGNSSSGVIEAPALHLPVVNVGDRQKGRLRSAGVIDVAADAGRVTSALREALAPSFRKHVRSQPAPFGEGRAADAIGKILSAWTPPDPPVKHHIGES
jgi:UDP-hydrolysing UDP-N-acetyl-D-glucosamine 2-epimerase